MICCLILVNPIRDNLKWALGTSCLMKCCTDRSLVQALNYALSIQSLFTWIQIARYRGPTWGPSGAEIGPCWTHELCYLSTVSKVCARKISLHCSLSDLIWSITEIIYWYYNDNYDNDMVKVILIVMITMITPTTVTTTTAIMMRRVWLINI